MSDITHEQFRSEFCRLSEGFSDLTLAKYFQVSKPTIGRWKTGVSAIHPVGRGPTIEGLKKLCRGCGKRNIECFEQSGGDIDPII